MNNNYFATIICVQLLKSEFTRTNQKVNKRALV